MGALGKSQTQQLLVSNLFRNVPFLTSLEMSLFVLICSCRVCSLPHFPGAKLGDLQFAVRPVPAVVC
jgi:hypothetical protein